MKPRLCKSSAPGTRSGPGGNKWVPGEVIKQVGPVLYHVSAKGMVWKHHADQL